MSTFQKIIVVSCVCVCVALLFPKLLLSGEGGGKRDPASVQGRFPPMLQRKSVSEPPRGSLVNSVHQSEAAARAKVGTTAGKSNLTGHVIPVYGFGILLYIIYIIFKITQRGKTRSYPESRRSAATSENMKRKITDFELSQLQQRLKETEDVMETIVSRARTHNENTQSAVCVCVCCREECVSVDQEKVLLLQLREISRVMQDGGQCETECDLFSDDPEELLKHWSSHCCPVHRQTDEETQGRADRQVEETQGRAGRQTGGGGAGTCSGGDAGTGGGDAGTCRQTGGGDAGMCRQTDSCKRNEGCDGGGEEEICTDMMKPKAQRWNTSPSGGHVIRHRSRRGTSRGTESCS